MNLIAFLLLLPAIAAYSISQLQQHGKFLLSKKSHLGFWGVDSWRRKYKSKIGKDVPRGSFDFIEPPNNWYYKFFNIAFVEKWPTSATFTVFASDGYHLTQFLFFLFLSLSITFAIGFDWWLLAGVWSGIHVVHAGVYKLLQR